MTNKITTEFAASSHDVEEVIRFDIYPQDGGLCLTVTDSLRKHGEEEPFDEKSLELNMYGQEVKTLIRALKAGLKEIKDED